MFVLESEGHRERGEVTDKAEKRQLVSAAALSAPKPTEALRKKKRKNTTVQLCRCSVITDPLQHICKGMFAAHTCTNTLRWTHH